MKESVWGYWLIVLGVFVVFVLLLVQNFTTSNTQDYYLIKSISESAMLDAVDYAYFNHYGEVKINKEKFYEAFLRRFAEEASIMTTYTIKFKEMYECPPKVGVEVTSKSNSFTITGDSESFDIVNRIDGILEVGISDGADDKKVKATSTEDTSKSTSTTETKKSSSSSTPSVKSDPITELKNMIGNQIPVGGGTMVMTSCFGDRIISGQNEHHNGIDMSPGNGNAIAITEGVVSQINKSLGVSDRGKYIAIKINVGGDEYEVFYQHLASISSGLSIGSKIKKGDVIGVVGSSGQNENSYAQHLHLEVCKGSCYVHDSSATAIDPTLVFPDTNYYNYCKSCSGSNGYDKNGNYRSECNNSETFRNNN